MSNDAFKEKLCYIFITLFALIIVKYSI